MKMIHGFLTTATPMNVASPEKVMKGEPSAIVRTKVIHGDRIDLVPYFPGNDLRGRMRRKCAEFLLPILAEKYGKGLPRSIYLGALSGSAYAAPSKDANSITQILKAHDNVFLGLFGGGPNLFQSGLRVNNVMPVLPSTVACGFVPESLFSQTPFEGKVIPASEMITEVEGVQKVRRGFDIMDKFHFVHIDDMARGLNAQLAKNNLLDYEKEIAAHAQRSMDNKQDRKEGEDVKKSDLANILSCRMIVPGVDMYTKITFDERINEAQIGLALVGLEGVLIENRLGGWGRIGFGQVKPNLVLECDDTRIELFAQDGQGVYRLTEAAQVYVDLAKEAILDLDLSEFLSLYEDKVQDEQLNNGEKVKKAKKATKEDKNKESEISDSNA